VVLPQRVKAYPDTNREFFRTRLGLPRGEEDQHRQVVEAVLDFGSYVDHAARGDFPVFIARAKTGTSADDVVQLIFVMRTLGIDGSSGEQVQTGAHGRHAQELAVQFAALCPLLVDLGEAGKQSVQARIPPKKRLVNCGTRLWVCSSPSGLYHW
jgi:hypothetical protein